MAIEVDNWNTNQALNTTVAGTDIDEGMLPGDLNDATRKIMAACRQMRDIGYFTDKNTTIQASGGALPATPIEGHLLFEY